MNMPLNNPPDRPNAQRGVTLNYRSVPGHPVEVDPFLVTGVEEVEEADSVAGVTRFLTEGRAQKLAIIRGASAVKGSSNVVRDPHRRVRQEIRGAVFAVTGVWPEF